MCTHTINFCVPDFDKNVCFVHPLALEGSVFGNNCGFNEAAHTRSHTGMRDRAHIATHIR